MQRIYRVGQQAEPSALAIRDVAALMKAGDLALLPTDTVYGVGVAVCAYEATRAMPEPDTGYRRIFSLKRRDLAQTVPWLVADASALDEFGHDVPDELRRIARVLWPGALTIVVPAAGRVPAYMRAADGTVALRAPASPVIQGLVNNLGSPLAVTSANTHGMPAPESFAAVEPRILSGVDVAVDAGATCGVGASTIVTHRDGELRILREGPIGLSQLMQAIDGAAHADERSS